MTVVRIWFAGTLTVDIPDGLCDDDQEAAVAQAWADVDANAISEQCDAEDWEEVGTATVAYRPERVLP